MKKDEFTNIVREIVSEEIRRELPKAIAEVFQNFMGQKPSIEQDDIPSRPKIKETPSQFKQSLKELFNGTPVIKPKGQSIPKINTKNPLLNEVLNNTRPFTNQERTGMPLGMAAMANMGQSGYSIPASMGMMDNIQQAHSVETSFAENPVPIRVDQSVLLRDDHIPLSNLPEGVSVMDVKQYAPPAVAEALTRDYSQIMKLIDKKKGKV